MRCLLEWDVRIVNHTPKFSMTCSKISPEFTHLGLGIRPKVCTVASTLDGESVLRQGNSSTAVQGDCW